ncbi:hypothetical protein ACJJTC_016310 [Scirpophaga incertulas]
MSKTFDKMVATKNKVVPCSTPERINESPSRDSDSLCDSESTSPVPFICTQDGVEGDTDVVWNYYTPKSENNTKSIIKNSTPLSRKVKKPVRLKIVDKQVPKRKVMKMRQFDEKTEFLKELVELNQNLPELLAKPKSIITKYVNADNDDDNLHNSDKGVEYSPKSGIWNSSQCLRKNVLSSKFSKIDPDTAIDSDDSINECLLKASQMVEEKFVDCQPTTPKRACFESNMNFKSNFNTSSEQDPKNTTKLESPVIRNLKINNFESPKLVNDSFDSFVGNLDDSALEQLTQMPIKSNLSAHKLKYMQEQPASQDNSPSSKFLFNRFSSMPESPTVIEINKPSTSGMVFGRYNSMPYEQNAVVTVDGDSPIRCTPEEIKRKHQQAREKLLAKRQLPFTSSQSSVKSLPEETIHKAKSTKFQPKIANSLSSTHKLPSASSSQHTSNTDMKLLIEKKRQEALMKLRRRQPKS